MIRRRASSRYGAWREAGSRWRLAGSAALLLTLLVGLGGWRAASAQDGEVTIEVVPAAIGVPADGPVEVQIVVRNRSDRPIDEIELSWFSDSGVTVQVDTTERIGRPPEAATASEGSRISLPQQVPAGTDRAWTAYLWRAPSGPLTGTVHVRATYSDRPADEVGTPAPRPVRRIIYADLAITPRAPDPITQPAEVAIDSTLTTLNESRSGWVFLRVTNTSQTVPIRVGAIGVESSLPKAIVLRPEVRDPVDSNAVWVLGPGESRSIGVDVEVEGVVQPGKQILIFDVPITWNDAGRSYTDHLIATHEVEVGVFGESEILTLLAVPGLFFLPGFLAVLAYSLFRVRLGLAPANEALLTKITRLDFWIVAITISLVAAAAYPWLTRTFSDVERDYRSAYSAWDLSLLWFGAILAGLLFVPLYLIGVRGFLAAREGVRSDARRVWAWHKAIPSPNDTPIQTLEKMAKRDEPRATPRRLVDVATDQGAVHGFRVVMEQTSTTAEWVAPLIVITWLPDTDSETKSKIRQELRKPEGGSARTLADLFRHGVKHQVLEVAWKSDPPALPGPFLAPKDTVTESNLGHIVEEATTP